ncbi:MAG: DUF5615 family PIN-like protein [Anaerolineae bacterium]|nr:DUF5615 family PIN-like protein [Anaerolineae bacterium]
MRILANENFPGDAISALRERGHDIAWVRSDAPGSSDAEVLARAQAEERILIDSSEITLHSTGHNRPQEAQRAKPSR